MPQSWLQILKELALSKSEKEIVDRFAAEPEGRSFLGVAEILKNHEAHEESVELLTEGLNLHPDFSVARVVLARELYSRGLADQCQRVLGEAPKPLKDNLLAQKLKLKSAIILGQDTVARTLIAQLKAASHLDEETRELVRTYEAMGATGLRGDLLQDFAAKGITLDASVYTPLIPSDQGQTLPSFRIKAAPEVGGQGPHSPSRTSFQAGFSSNYFNAEAIPDDQAIRNFHVVPIYEIFHPNHTSTLTSQTTPHQLDSATLADIYTKQGHYTKALEVYKRLLRVTPGHDLIKRRIAELTRLEQQQKVQDQTVDPELVDRMESVSVLDKQIDFLQNMMNRIRTS